MEIVLCVSFDDCDCHAGSDLMVPKPFAYGPRASRRAFRAPHVARTLRSRPRQRKPRLQYPLPHGCHAAAHDIGTTHLEDFSVASVNKGAAWTATAWVDCKTTVRKDTLRTIRCRRSTQRRAYKQRLYRLRRAVRCALGSANLAKEPPVIGDETGEQTATCNEQAAKVGALRATIIRVRKARTRRRRREKFALAAASTPAGERAFFRRFDTRQGQRTCAAIPVQAGDERSQAERLADDWRTITQRGPTAVVARERFFALLPSMAPLSGLEALDLAFTEHEVRDAIQSCPRGKAAGPDGLPNDWYRDHEDELADVLTPLLNTWHRQSTLPPSFRHAAVACIPKTSTPKSGLDFRPIALLDTDYKIYSRLLLNRVRDHLPGLVAPTQFGFVPGRQVHDALDVFHGLQTLARDGDAPQSSVAVLLDFAKAYDTLDRDFLERVLRRLGFPPLFLAAVSQMHLHTTAEYNADDGVSERQDILNGIRQGCPLAPTLFVLAVNVLYEAIAADATIPGIALPGGEEVGATGFADDTTVFLATAAATPALCALLSQFADASGLHVNYSKCVVVALTEAGHGLLDGQLGFPSASCTTMSRLLGCQVATTLTNSAVWDLTLQQIRTRMHLAALKTTNVLQRVKLVRAIVVPKILFIARHHWPTATLIAKMQRLVDTYVWTGAMSGAPQRQRGWTSRGVAHAAEQDGGLAIPHLTHEIQAMSVAVVERWARPRSGLGSAVGQILLRTARTPDGVPTPTRHAVAMPTLQATLADTGLQLRRSLAVQPRSPTEELLLQQLLPLVGRGTSRDFDWEQRNTGEYWLRINHDRVKDRLATLRQLQAVEFGNLNIPGLLQSNIYGDGLLLHKTGRPAQPADFPHVAATGDRFRDVVELDWHPSGDLLFRPVRLQFPLAPVAAESFRRLCDSIVFQYPGLLRRPGQPDDLVLRPPSLDVWRIRRTMHAHHLEWRPVGDLVVALGPVTTTAAATAVARRVLDDTTVRFELHDWLDQPYALWRGGTAPTPATAKQLLRGPSEAQVQRESTARRRRWEEADADIASALHELSWRDVMRIPGAPAAQRLLLHKLKGDRVSPWERVNGRQGCPHCPSITGGGKAVHMFWQCPTAARLWSNLLHAWDPLWRHPRQVMDSTVKTDIFSLRLQVMPDGLWDHPEHRRLGDPTSSDTIATHAALQAAWRRQVLATFYVLWRWRTAADADTPLWAPAHAVAYQDAELRAVLSQLEWPHGPGTAATRHTAAALAVLSVGLTTQVPRLPQQPVDASATYLLFFDGGSRGNPGPGGSGSVIVATDPTAATASIIWSAAMSSRRVTTTNNQAEYTGLLTGLTEATRRGWTPLEVVGDSQMILRQMQQYKPPQQRRLREDYARARRLADTLGVQRWHHHYRAHNKMADAAANLAMDTRASSQTDHPTHRRQHADLEKHLCSDFIQWQTSRFAT